MKWISLVVNLINIVLNLVFDLQARKNSNLIGLVVNVCQP